MTIIIYFICILEANRYNYLLTILTNGHGWWNGKFFCWVIINLGVITFPSPIYHALEIEILYKYGNGFC
jgi:hypothetical protein